MSFDSYPLRMLIAIGVTIGGIFLIVGILTSAPNFFVGMLILIPIVPLLRLVGDIANPDVDVPLNAQTMLHHYVAVLFFLILMLGALLLTVPVVAVGLAMLGAALAILVGLVGLALWAFQHGFGLSLGRPLAVEELWDILLFLGGGIGGGLLAFGLMYLGLVIKDHYETPFWSFVHRLQARIEQLNK